MVSPTHLHIHTYLSNSSDAPKRMIIQYDQPQLIPPPIPQPQERPDSRSRSKEWTARTKSMASRASSRGSFSIKRTFNAYNGYNAPRRPQIGEPSDFRHVGSMDMSTMPRRTGYFRPLELSIYTPDNHLSPILPHFSPADSFNPEPSHVRTHSRTMSTQSYQIPRKPVRSGSHASSEWSSQYQPQPGSLSTQELLAAIASDMPQAPPPARLRSMTEPLAYERVKSALHEKFELEQRLRDIDSVIEERQSIYMSSRPVSRAASQLAIVCRPVSIYAESQGTFLLPYSYELSRDYLLISIRRANALHTPHIR